MSVIAMGREPASTDVEIVGYWMPCEYIQNAKGLYRVTLLGDIEFSRGANKGAWRETIGEAAEHQFESIAETRKLSIRQLIPSRPIDECPYRHRLKSSMLATPPAALQCAA